WEKFASQMLVNLDRSTVLKRLAYKAAMSVGRRYATYRWQHRAAPSALALAYGLARAVVFKPMLMKIGMHKVRAALTAGAPIPPPIQSLWQVLGVNLRNLYGITEHTLLLCPSERFPPPRDVAGPLHPHDGH